MFSLDILIDIHQCEKGPLPNKIQSNFKKFLDLNIEISDQRIRQQD